VHDSAVRIPIKGEPLTLEDITAERFRCYTLGLGDDIICHNEARRILNGEVCLVAISGGEISGDFWYLVARIKYEPLIETIIRIADEEVLTYNMYILPKFRRMAISEKMSRMLMAFFKSTGFRKMITLTKFDNVPA